ncbi:MAG: hypothetical protein L0H59_05285 [Tomitella sp.]|nr:hypothetical protein [Tomitella sp.]
MPTDPTNAALKHLSWLECAAAIRSDIPHMRECLATGYQVTAAQREAFELVYFGVSTDTNAVDHPVVVDQWLRLLAHHPEALPSSRGQWWSRVVLADADGRALTDPIRIGPRLPLRVDASAMRGRNAAPVFIPTGVMIPATLAGLGGWFISQIVPVSSVVMLWIAAGCMAIAATAGYLVTIRKDRRIIADRPDIAPQDSVAAGDTRTELWQQARARFDAVRSEYIEFETDPTGFFFRPLLADVTHPAVQEFHDAFAAAQSLYVDDERPPDDTQWVRQFAARAAAAESAWQAADELARATGTARLSPEQQQLMRRAASLVNLALDESASSTERAVAYRQVTDMFANAHIPTPESIGNGLRGRLEAANVRVLPPGAAT